jgi:hypothetical protein
MASPTRPLGGSSIRCSADDRLRPGPVVLNSVSVEPSSQRLGSGHAQHRSWALCWQRTLSPTNDGSVLENHGRSLPITYRCKRWMPTC